MEAIASTVSSCFSCQAMISILQEAKSYVRYVIIFEKKVEKFEEKMEELRAKRKSVQLEIEAAERNAETIKPDVKLWCDKVDKIIPEEEKKMKELEDRARDNCCIGLCPNIKSRYQLSTEAEKGTTDVDELLKKGEKFSSVSCPAPPPDTLPPAPEYFKAFESRVEIVSDMVKALKDANTNVIGVYGMGGVGKTTLVIDIGREALKNELFDNVCFVAVNQVEAPDLPKIQDKLAETQDKLAEQLGLKLEAKSVELRASRLCQRLKRETKVLVIVDDVWKEIDLMKLGIPSGDKLKGCKVLLTSRDLNVLRSEINTQKNFKISVLEDEEAWDLFKKIAGSNFENPELQTIAMEVAKECAGLPIAIETVAKTLRNKGLYEWNDALRKLQRPSPTNFKGIPAKVYSAIELSYNHLETEELKQTFLLCGLLGHDTAIQDLLKYSIGLGIFDGVNTVAETRDRLLTVVNNLKDSSLLRDSYCNVRVDMHDLIYNVALAIASRDSNAFILKQEHVLKNWPDRDTMEKCTMISLRYANISEFPKELKCPQLTFFYLGSRDPSVNIPDSFFKEMRTLKVLDLTKMRFSSLPSSISLLKNLHTLCLDQCVLEDIALIGDLKNLEVLSLLSSDIEVLPKDFGQLNRLKLLDLSDCTKLKIIPTGLLSSLSKLEELYMDNSFVHWEEEGQANASLDELKALSYLTTLYVQILDPRIIPRDLFPGNLKRYKIYIGDQAWDWFDRNESSKTLKLKLNTSIHHLDHGIKKLLRNIDNLYLYLDDMRSARIVLEELQDEHFFRYLKNLHIQNGLEIRYIVYDNDAVDKIEFLQLQSLTLQDLPQLISFYSDNEWSSALPQNELPLFSKKMVFHCLKNLHLSSLNVERIWHKQLSNESNYTMNLTNLVIKGCGNLKHLLSSSMARSLAHLKHFEIIECKCLREIIFMEDIEENKATISFPQLKSLKISNLRHLIGFCSKHFYIEFTSLKLLEIEHCPRLEGFMHTSTVENQCFGQQALFNEKVAFPTLEMMTISHLRNMNMIWHNHLYASSFCKLERLSISNCGSLQEVFGLNVSDMEATDTQVVPTQLRELYISHLPKLKHIWNKDPRGTLTFQNLCEVHVFECWSLKNVFPASVAKVLPQLKDLTIASCGVEEVVSKREGLMETVVAFKFDQVSTLMLWDLPNLKCFYPGVHTTKWPMLKKLKVFHCNQMKIFDVESLYNLPNEEHLLDPPTRSPLFWVEKVIRKLEEVCLNCEDIAIISKNNFRSDLLHDIKVLNLLCYHNQSAAFPITFLERFKSLEKLEVTCCKFEELFSGERGVTKGTNARIILPIRDLRLYNLCKLKHIWKHESRLDSILPNLETLEVVDCAELIFLGLSSAAFRNLVTLDVCECEKMINLVTSSSVQSLVQLKNLKIRNCVSLKEIVGSEEADESTYDITFNRLKCLELRNLPRLKMFASGNHTYEFPYLDQVIVSHVPELEIFCKGELKAPMLQRVQVGYEDDKGQWIGDLKSTVQDLYAKKVEHKGMEYLILSDFSKSIEIWKQNLQKSLDFKNLQYLEVSECNLTYIFTSSMALDLIQLRKIIVKNCPRMEQIIRDDVAEEATTNTIMFLSLKCIVLESCSNLTCFYMGSNSVEYPSLAELVVVYCPEMCTFASTLSIDPAATQSLFNDKVTFSNLTALVIRGNGNWTKIWETEPNMNSFHELNELVVRDCTRLLNIFPLNMIGRLDKLEILHILDCKSLEEIIGDDHGLNFGESTATFVFSKMRFLAFHRLPNLKSFSSKMHSIDWPSLTQLQVTGCNNVETLAKEFISVPAENLGAFRHPLFCVGKDAFRNLEWLILDGNNIMKKIWDGQLPTQSFCKLKNLVLIKIPHASLNILNCFIKALALPNLENLALIDSPFTEIFQCKALVGEQQQAGALDWLCGLRLQNLAELTNLWKENFSVGEVYSNLGILQVVECGKLRNLVPSFVHFGNLTTLEVSQCHGLEVLVTPATAMSMVLLTKIRITACQMIEAIVALESDEVKDEIVFSQLKSLELNGLPSLSSFCSGNYAIGLPSLEEFILRNCPKMKSFCQGELSTPNLQKVQFAEDKERWDGNLKATIEQIFIEINIQASSSWSF